MFQSFEDVSQPEFSQSRVQKLREQLETKSLDGFLVPRADAFQGEYVAKCDERLSWLTGFTGSAGFALILSDRAAMFTDGRYKLQVRDQCDPNVFDYVDWPETSLIDWLQKLGLPNDLRIGFDPMLHPIKQIEGYQKHLRHLTPCENLVDKIWEDRPLSSQKSAFSQPLEFAGTAPEDKLAQIKTAMKDNAASHLILTQPDSICWLLNIRGHDIEHTPIVQCFAILHFDEEDMSMSLFGNIDSFRDIELSKQITLQPFSEFTAAIKTLSGKVMIDPATAPYSIQMHLPKTSSIVKGSDPCLLPKARKNGAELKGARRAHKRDAIAVIETLAWIDDQPTNTLSEIQITQYLENARRNTEKLVDIAFDTICGSGPNGAIVHYRVTKTTDRILQNGEFLLLDSGGQYQDGTTDITRTIPIGQISDEMKQNFTAVLQGMIAISTVKFPKGVSGAHLDSLARAPLWRLGRDFDHGTGHGVGSFLSVHEGPQRISRISNTPLETGMILSNEPGYYVSNAYGIRIENLIAVQDMEQRPERDTRDMLEFETLTLVPIDRRAIILDQLAPFEIEWLNTYHKSIADMAATESLSPLARQWLDWHTAPL